MYRKHGSEMEIGPFKTSRKELKDLLKAWIVISIAFGIILPSFLKGRVENAVLVSFIAAPLTVGLGFIIHELGHKLVAQKYGCFAEFRSFDQMLILALLMAYFFKIVFAAPGAVMISGPVGVKRNGKISMAGPLASLMIAGVFALILLFIPLQIVQVIAWIGLYINAFLALFNMIPVWQFDGAKILRWNKVVYFSMVVGALALFLFSGVLGGV